MIEKQDDFTTLVTDDINTIKTKKEVEKLQAEIDKIKNENEELTKKWYLRPQYIGAISPIIVGLLTIELLGQLGFYKHNQN